MTLAGVTLGVTLFGVPALVVGPLLLSSLGVPMEVFALANRPKRPAGNLTEVNAPAGIYG